MAFRDIGIDSIDPRCQTAAALNMCFLRDHNGQLRIPAQSQRCIAACCTSSDDQHVCRDPAHLEIFTHGTILSVSCLS